MRYNPTSDASRTRIQRDLGNNTSTLLTAHLSHPAGITAAEGFPAALASSKMSLVIPNWVAHITSDDSTDPNEKDKKKHTTIFSLNVHPDGSRLATGGIDQKIRIWATEPILDEKVDSVPGTHRLLSTLSRHSGAVLAVRFSPSGRYLASGSDDTVCLIWEFDPSGTGGGSFGSFGSTEQNIESWRVHRRLTAHESDVVDIAWSADDDDSYLATVGLDATVSIWGGPALNFERIKTIRAHDGFVKGVVWDPRGQYLATQSDDKTVKVWKTSDWSCAKVIQDPFVNSPTSNFFGRLSWSPDGAHIVAANAMNGPVFISSIIERDTWESDLKLVGHEDSVVVTAFSPRLFRPTGDKADATPAAIVALGSRDQSVSIWITGNTRPIIVLKDIFERQVTDLSWSQDGLTVYASSTAGAVAAVTLDKNMFREIVPRDALAIVKPQVGHERSLVPGMGGRAGAATAGTAQRPNVLQPRKGGNAVRPASARPPAAIPTAPSAGSALPRPANARAGGQRLNQQIVILPNGKRRIRPTLVGGQEPDDAGQSMMDLDAGPAQQQQQQQQAQITHFPQMGGAATQSSGPAAGVSTSQLLEVLSQLPALQQQQQQPQTAPQPSIPLAELPAIVSALKDLTGPSTTYRTTDQSFEAALAVVRQSKAKAREGRVIGQDVPVSSGGSGALVRSGVASDEASSSTSREPPLAPPPVQATLRRSGEGGSVEVNNFIGEESQNRAVEVRVSDDSNRLLFMDFLSRQVARCALSLGYVALALTDGTLQVYTCKGRLLWTMSLDSPTCFLECKGSVLLVITCSGNLHRWNLQEDVELHRPMSCLSLLHSRDDVHQVYLHSNGAPILILRTMEQAWTVDAKKNTWVCIADGWYASASEAWDGRARGRGTEDTPSVSHDDEYMIVSVQGDTGRWREPMKTIESEINSLLVAGGGSTKTFRSNDASSSRPLKRKWPPADDEKRTSEFRLTSTLRHMEMRLQGALLLNSKDEYTSFLKSYARKIANENLKGLGEELVRELIGPIYSTSANAGTWEATLFDGTLHKRSLAKETIQILKKSRGLEGMCGMYVDLLKSMGV